MDHSRHDSVMAGLNPGQLRAVEQISGGWLSGDGGVRLTIVDGPPGTGKTHVAAAATGQWVLDRRGRVIILCPTHAAAQRVHEKLSDVGFGPQEALRLAFGPVGYNQQTGVMQFEEVGQLPPNFKRVLQQADVLITTWQGSQRAFSIARNFLLMMDEVSQVSFAAFLAIIKRAYPQRPTGYTLLGDPQQLPVIATQEVLATNAALAVLRRHPECEPVRLSLQYRMNGAICRIINEVRRVAFGGEPLIPGNEQVASRTLDHVAGRYEPKNSIFADILDPQAPVIFVDTSSLCSQERAVGTSWEYEAEARLVTNIAKAVDEAYRPNLTAVSSPYTAQVALMRKLGAPQPITIYQAQGHEWDCVVLSLARTAGRTIMDEVYQNMYVGLSRARSKLIVLLNVKLFGAYRLFGSILQLVGHVPGIKMVRANPDWVSS
jgi:hypothetical protein